MLSYYSTDDQRLAVILATLGLQPSHHNPVSHEELSTDRSRICFHFEPAGNWAPFGGQPETPIRAEEIAAAYADRPSNLPAGALEELQSLRAAMRTPGTFQAMRKSPDPSVSYLAIAASENASILAKLAAAAPKYRRQKLRRGTLHAPVDRWEEALHTFKSFR